jgi:hypothetical protein
MAPRSIIPENVIHVTNVKAIYCWDSSLLGFGGLAAKLIDLLFLIFLIIVVSTLLAKLYICF